MATKEFERGNVFDEIAESWYRLRHWSRFKPELEEMSARWHSGRLLNIGCAHGPDFLPFKDNFELYGVDNSVEMLRMAIKYSSKFNFHAGLVVADAVDLPFRDGCFDHIIAVASYHHIQGKNNRVRAFREMRRVLKPGAEFFLTVWNRQQYRFWFKGKEVIVPWKTNARKYDRYHYLYTYNEIEKLLKASGLNVIKSYAEFGYSSPIKHFSRNICVLGNAGYSVP